MVVRNLLIEPCDELRPLGTWTHEAHVALQHVPQLRNFIHARLAKKFAHPRDSRIVVLGPGWACIRLSVSAHSAKFVAAEDRRRRVPRDSASRKRAQRELSLMAKKTNGNSGRLRSNPTIEITTEANRL